MYPRSAIKTYKGSGVNPAGAEQPFIYKDPPIAIPSYVILIPTLKDK